MIVKDNVQIAELVKRIFRETYGVEDDELYHNAELCEKIRNAVKILRGSYKPTNRNSDCDSFYNDEDIRKAYMIAYYPYYIEPSRYVLNEKSVLNALYDTVLFEYETVCYSNTGDEYTVKAGGDFRAQWSEFCNNYPVNLSFFASGPCPELIGVVTALKEHCFCDAVNITTFDAEPEWLPHQQTTWKLYQEQSLLPLGEDDNWKFYNYSVGDMSVFEGNANFVKRLNSPDIFFGTENRALKTLSDTNIFFLQNYLSHVSETPGSCKNFLEWFLSMIKWVSKNSLFVFIDLNYNSTSKVFSELVDERFLAFNGLKKIAAHIPANGEPLTIRHGDTTQALRDNIFTDTFKNFGSKFIQKKLTNFYYVVLQKTKANKSLKCFEVSNNKLRIDVAF